MSLKINDTITPALQRLARELADTGPVETTMGKAFMKTAREEHAKLLLRKVPWPPRKGWYKKHAPRMPLLTMSQTGGKTVVTSTGPLFPGAVKKAREAALNAGTQWLASIIERP